MRAFPFGPGRPADLAAPIGPAPEPATEKYGDVRSGSVDPTANPSTVSDARSVWPAIATDAETA